MFFRPITIPYKEVNFEMTNKEYEELVSKYNVPFTILDKEDEIYKRNSHILQLAQMDLNRDIANKNLLAQYRIMMVTLLATVIALISSGVGVYLGLRDKPTIINQAPITVKAPPAPTVNVQLPAKQ